MLRGFASSVVQAQRSCLSRCSTGWYFVGLHSSVASRSADMATAAAASAADDFLLELQRARPSIKLGLEVRGKPDARKFLARLSSLQPPASAGVYGHVLAEGRE